MTNKQAGITDDTEHTAYSPGQVVILSNGHVAISQPICLVESIARGVLRLAESDEEFSSHPEAVYVHSSFSQWFPAKDIGPDYDAESLLSKISYCIERSYSLPEGSYTWHKMVLT